MPITCVSIHHIVNNLARHTICCIRIARNIQSYLSDSKHPQYRCFLAPNTSMTCTLGTIKNPKSTRERVPQPRGKFKNRKSSSYATLAACHQKAAATADKMESSGTHQAQPNETPVQPAPAKAASTPKTLRMIGHRSPDQLQFQPPAQRRQRVQPPAEASPRIFPAMSTTRPSGFPVRPIRVLPAGSALN